MAGARAKWKMLAGILFLLQAGVFILLLMAVVEAVAPFFEKRLSNCWWYAMVKFWREGGAVVMTQSQYTTLTHFFHTCDLELFYAFDPVTKSRRLLPPPLFTGVIGVVPRWAVLQSMARKDL